MNELYRQAEQAFARQDYETARQHLLPFLTQAPTPEHGQAHLLLGRSAQRLQRWQESLKHYLQAQALMPEDYRGYLGAAEVWHQLRQTLAEIQSLQHCLQARPDQPQARLQIALSFYSLGDPETATQWLKPVLEPDSDWLQSCSQESQNYFQTQFWIYHSYRLFMLYADPRISDDALFQAIQTGLKHFPHPPSAPLYSPEVWKSSGPLKVGYLSRELGKHASSLLLEPLLRHASKQVYNCAYHDGPALSSGSSRLRPLFQEWHEVGGLSQQALAQRIVQDRIQILVDLGGLTLPQRHEMLALRPAPLQITGPGFLFSAAHPASDLVFSDATLCPPQIAAQYPEKIQLLESAFHLCPPEPLPLTPPPYLEQGFVTLGSANPLAKLNGKVIALWSQILLTLPQSQLFLKNPCFNDLELRPFLRQKFARYGIAPERIRIEGSASEKSADAESHLAYFYRQLDLALDPFPYQGGINSFEALWMGVPLLVLSQPQWQSRALSVSLLKTLKLESWLNNSPAEYLRRAQSWSQDPDFLQAYRLSLRPRLLDSPLCDGPAYVHKLEGFYQQSWQARRYTERNPSSGADL